MLLGVVKSGSPSAKSRTSIPFAFNRLASAPIARVAEGAIKPARSARLNGMESLLRLLINLARHQTSRQSIFDPRDFPVVHDKTQSKTEVPISTQFTHICTSGLLNSIARGKLCCPGNLYGADLWMLRFRPEPVRILQCEATQSNSTEQ